jgi:hypothetical protein
LPYLGSGDKREPDNLANVVKHIAILSGGVSLLCRCVKMSRKIRFKLCEICSQPAPILYRVKHEDGGNWVFVCPQCWPNISENNPFYVYGGTWKVKKRKK